MKTLTTGEIAKLCDVNLRTVIRWIDRGALTGFKLPGRGNNRVREEDFIAFLHEHGMPVPPGLQQTISRQILIVDDEPAVAKSIQRVLRSNGYETLIATDGFQAGSMLSIEKPALMTLDLSMPGLDGYGVIECVRSTSELSGLKILVISALGEASLEKALAAGADAVLQKPFENEQLLKSIQQLLKK
ncbi:DNA binding domain-containing protein, excisionase family [Amphritea atlantica]|jgi:excisionase family DNA binding protein|uniref:DNA binding domain-containing protein, excisionase family n=1 Tax=Amphritea atlantica TaxID=355243 RepID=A0A1H9IYJ1_9GAMM|nr:response regulator [Amphritea atlantica]SEQ79455.1 DNA binding domain-containing protein, excisionase family [Amphritea atlantica]